MARGRAGSEEYWKSVIKDYLTSGCGQVAYCQRHKISKASLHKWSRQLGIPLKQRQQASQFRQSKNNEESLSFIALNVPAHMESAAIPLKLDLFITPERQVKIETIATWDNVVGLVKALVV